MFFWNCLAFLMIQQMLAIWSLVPLPFLKPAWTSGSSQFTTPGVYSNSCPLNQWCHPTISSSVIPFSSHLQSFSSSGSFQISKFFKSGGQNIRDSALASVLPMNIQDRLPLGWTGWVSLLSKWLKSLLQYHSSKASVLCCSTFFIVQLSHLYMTTGKTITLTRQTPLLVK